MQGLPLTNLETIFYKLFVFGIHCSLYNFIATIKIIIKQWMTQVFHVNSYLVCTSGFQNTFNQADPRAGRVTFAQTCAVCHRLYGEGAEFGPDLTGSGRHVLSYLLENIADPSAVVPADFRLNIVTLKDGRVLSGALGAKTERTIAVRSAGGSETIELSEIAKTEQFGQSPMPEGLLIALSETQVRDLFAYLMSDAQVALPAAK